MSAALGFDFDVDGVITQKCEGVSIRVFKSGGDCAPGLRLRGMVKAHAVAAPFFELGEDVFGQEDDLSRAADKLVFIGAGFRSNEREHSGAIRGSDGERIFGGRERDVSVGRVSTGRAWRVPIPGLSDVRIQTFRHGRGAVPRARG